MNIESKQSDSGSIGTARQLAEALSNLVEKSYETAIPESVQDGTNALWSQEWKAWMSGSTLKSLFFTEQWVFILVNLIADEISQHPMQVYRKSQADGEKVVYEPVANHPVNAIFENPNPYQDYYNWMYSHIVEDVLGGNGIQLYSKKNEQFTIVPFETVQLEFDAKGEVESYIFATVTEETSQQLTGIRLDPKLVLHQKRPNPSSVFWGLSPFIPGRKGVLFDRFTSDYLNAFYIRQALPGLAIKMDKDASEDRALRLLRSYEMSYTGRQNSRRTLVLPKGTDVKTLSHTIADQNLIELVRLNRETTINILRVPKHALSLAETGSLGSEEHKQALKYFWSSTLKPLCKQTGGCFTKFLKDQKMLADNELVMFDLSDVEVLQDDQMKKAQFGTQVKDQWTLNEIRTEVWNKEPIEGGDKLPGAVPPAIPFGLSAVPQSTPATTPSETPTTEASLESVATNASAENALDSEIERRHRALTSYLEKKGEWWDARCKAIKDETDKVETMFREVFVSLVVGWAEDSIKALKDTAKALSGLDTIDKDHRIKAKADPKKIRRRMVEEYNKRQNEYLDSVMSDMQDVLDKGYGMHLQTIFDEENLAAILAIGERDAKNRYRILKAREVETFKTLRDTTVDRIMPIIEDGMKEQKTIQQIAKDITDSFGDPEFSSKRAMTVARTEVLTAVSIGQATALENALEVVPDMKKVWINAGDERVRGNPDGLYADSKSDHWHLQGQIKDAKDPFVDEKNGARIDYPRDVKAPANETINCRCTWLMVPPEDMDALNIPTV